VADAIVKGYSSSRQIAQYLSDTHGVEVHHSTVLKDTEALSKDLRESAQGVVHLWRGVSLERYEGMIRKLSAKLDDPVSVDDEGRSYDQSLPIIRLMKDVVREERKMLGLDMPTKIAHTNPEGDQQAQRIPVIPEEVLERIRGRQREIEVEEIEDAEIVGD
jgi:hypothetical protein